jgi:hypothetical protein
MCQSSCGGIKITVGFELTEDRQHTEEGPASGSGFIDAHVPFERLLRF